MSNEFNLVKGYLYDVKIPYPNEQFGVSKFRLLLFDEFEVLVEEYLQGSGWYFEKLSSFRFARMSRKFFERNLLAVTESHLSPKLENLIGSDLPIRLGRLKNISWGNTQLDTEQSISLLLKKDGFDKLGSVCVNTKQIYLEPSGKGGGSKPAKLVEAKNGKYFTLSEIIWQANNFQKNFETRYKEGIGIFRAGVKSKLPSYYIGEYYDLAGIMRKLD